MDWTTDMVDDAGVLNVADETERIEPLALVISMLPLIGLVGGAISLARGKRRNGWLMILIGICSFVILSAMGSLRG